MTATMTVAEAAQIHHEAYLAFVKAEKAVLEARKTLTAACRLYNMAKKQSEETACPTDL